MIPKRRKRPKMGLRERPQLRSEAHLQWVRGHECALTGKMGSWRGQPAELHVCQGSVQAAHVRIGTDGGAGVKPSDNWTLPLCMGAHAQQHAIGEAAFEAMWGIDMKAIACEVAKNSPPLIRLRKIEHAVGCVLSLPEVKALGKGHER